jgi:hypothetical protein
VRSEEIVRDQDFQIPLQERSAFGNCDAVDRRPLPVNQAKRGGDQVFPD